MKITNIIEISDGKVMKIHSKYYLSVESLQSAVRALVESYEARGWMDVNKSPRDMQVFMPSVGYITAMVIRELTYLDDFRMDKLLIGVVFHEAE